jgi:hypothetical protein
LARRRFALMATTRTRLTLARLMATMDLAGSPAACLSERVRGSMATAVLAFTVGAGSSDEVDLTAGVDSRADAGSTVAVDLGRAPWRADRAASLTARPAAGSAVARREEAFPVAALTAADMAAGVAKLRS